MEPVHLTEYDDGRMLLERPALVDDMTRLDNEWLLIDGDRSIARTSPTASGRPAKSTACCHAMVSASSRSMATTTVPTTTWRPSA
jgi:hypothetical protein